MENQRRHFNRSPITSEARQAQQNLSRIWRIYRSEHGWRQADLAQALGIGQAAVSQYLSGELSLNSEIILRLAGVFGVNPNEIWPGLVPAVQPIEDVLSPDVLTLAREIEQLPLQDRHVVQNVVERFALARHAQE